jgi:hypothetical protein
MMQSKRLMWSIAAALIVVACSNSQEARESAPPAPVEQRLPTIDHVSPRRDSVGHAPTRFEWTAAEGANQYAIGIWNDVDRLMWRSDHVRGTSVDVPKDVEFEFGTYFWMVTALQDDRPVAESGRAAFVVTTQ